MADVDQPKTPVEKQDVTLPRTQPESPKREGIDPLTESDTMYPATDTKTDSEKQSKLDNEAPTDGSNSADVDSNDKVHADQTALANDANSQAANADNDDAASDNVNSDGQLPADAKPGDKLPHESKFKR